MIMGLASAARARGLRLARPNSQAQRIERRRCVSFIGKFGTSGQQP